MKLYFSEDGKGIPLILLHGFPFDHSIWDKVLDGLSIGIRAITPDLRGAGKSATDSQTFTIADMAADVVGLMDQLSILKAHIAGHSMGGYVALEIAFSYPDRTAGLALTASHIYADSPEKRASRLKLIAEIRQSTPAEMLAGMPKSLSQDKKVQAICGEYINRADTNGVIGSLHAMAERQSREVFWQESKMPKAVIAGENDQLIPFKTSRKVAALAVNCNLYQIEKAGHMPMLENPAVLTAALNDWISKLI